MFLADGIQQRTQHFILGFDGFQVCLVGPFGDHKIWNLLRQIHIGSLLFNRLTICGHIISKARAIIPSDFDPNPPILFCLQGCPVFLEAIRVDIGNVVGGNPQLRNKCPQSGYRAV